MKNIVRIIGVGMAALAGILLISGVAWAQANQTPVSGTVGNFVITDPGKEWVDEEGVYHWRNAEESERYFGDIRGRQLKITSGNGDQFPDPVTGEFFAEWHGYFTFVGNVGAQGTEQVTATGRIVAQCTGRSCEETDIWHLEDGRKILLTEVWSVGSAPPPCCVYEGTILDPPGLGPVKRNRPRNR
jgi:hypothetical protein